MYPHLHYIFHFYVCYVMPEKSVKGYKTIHVNNPWLNRPETAAHASVNNPRGGRIAVVIWTK